MSNENTLLFALPLELRELIYKYILLDPSQGPEILQACHDINTEARKFLYQRPIVFRSQAALNDWLEGRPRDVLQDVHELSLELQDVDLTPLLVSDRSADSHGRTRSLRTWELYEEELDRLDQAFTKLPNITTLSIRATSGRQTHLYEDFMAKALHMIASHWPLLRDLALEGNMHAQSLGVINDLRALTAFSFDGFCGTEPAETAALLSRLCLTRMSIVSQPGLLTPTRGQHSNFTSKIQSFDASVLRSVDQLAYLSISERVPSAASSALFFTSEILGSLHSHKTLSTLSLRSSHAPDEDTLDALNEFLKKSISVIRLELDWPHLNPAILYILTSRLKSLWIRAASLSVASDILGALLESREDGGVQKLRKVVLVRDNWDAGFVVESQLEHDDEDANSDLEEEYEDEDSNEFDFAALKTSLNELGIEVAWHTEVQ
ncbi:uncharacterized protein CC84DRAFT_1214537 [Paraphaeosphaeria sporulosa]|uniref:F-box domain-containing protein n=1 Tax=Paraphaeosphaeria sporulosa TaxID=1460663 RepID=A0A177CKD8_9PLEO|nr:uncharacterized protein CC84DRAFT_1214537 [Paraphaeosphaeria sporulosa]OAG07985.1 hypothetical protein CC84DRAFT_1214537 [Paraphaeosphaeria sporulosa]